MKRNIRSIVIAAFLIAVSFVFVFQGNGTEPPFTTVHFFNIQSTDEAKLLSVFQEFNTLFSTLGYSNVQYHLWKFVEGDTAKHSYLWDSVWPNRTSYDKVHQDEAYKKLVEKYRSFLEEILKDQIYYRFNEVLLSKVNEK